MLRSGHAFDPDQYRACNNTVAYIELTESFDSGDRADVAVCQTMPGVNDEFAGHGYVPASPQFVNPFFNRRSAGGVGVHSGVQFDRAHFKEYGNFSLNFEIVYYVIGADYNKYMDIQQNINLRIYEEFEKRGIEFAYPTQTLFLNKTE